MKNNYTKFEEDIDKSMNQTTIFGTERNGTERKPDFVRKQCRNAENHS